MSKLSEAMNAAQSASETKQKEIKKDVKKVVQEIIDAPVETAKKAEVLPEPEADPAEKTEQAQAPVTAVTVTQPAEIQKISPLEMLAEDRKKQIRELNPDFDLDFMNVFTRLKLNSKGEFMYSLAGQDTVLDDKIKIKLLAGAAMHQYWGEKGTEEEGTLVCYSTNGRKCAVDGTACSECPYNKEKCQLRYAIALRVVGNKDEEDEIFNYNMPPTGAFAFSDYVKLVTKKYRKGIKDIITVMYTETEEGKDKTQKYNAIKFKPAD